VLKQELQHVEEYNCLVILGATATGKTRRAVDEALSRQGEIISADSRQVYKGLDIGTGKDLNEYGSVPYHLIDIRELGDEYNVFQFQKDVYSIFFELLQRGTFPIIAGGTPLYLDSILQGYDMVCVPCDEAFRKEAETMSLEELASELLHLRPNLHNKTDLKDRMRAIRAIEIARAKKASQLDEVQKKKRQALIKPRIIGLHFEKDELERRIYARLLSRLEQGMIEEVEALHDGGVSWAYLESLGLEYRFTSQYLQGKIETKDEYTSILFRHICKFAKRQKTWFRKMERCGLKIEWI